ncbi:uncharacterized protein LOC111701333 [Eurytemora carolleeae]|uniref:uncharacterized protein LOC111701333 n=1 Tax=Eurytemora carolleeae TaxID=1294199 RepID=UPI000C75B032|nr:uncharacterized protein LOC111701333 [Eurytemora carolleeae]|eukprot:XP_023328346.1 uncharacterized protein LOC111701333 [Eurytemora affinis]
MLAVRFLFLFVMALNKIGKTTCLENQMIWKIIESVKETELSCLIVTIDLPDTDIIPTSEMNTSVLKISKDIEKDSLPQVIKQSGCVRFLVDSETNIQLAEELCIKPTSCLTIFMSDQQTRKISLKPETDPQLVRVLIIPKNPQMQDFTIKLICPYCREKIKLANLWKRTRNLLYPRSNIKCCFYLTDRGHFQVPAFVRPEEGNYDPSNTLRDEYINGKLVPQAKTEMNALMENWFLKQKQEVELVPFFMTSLMSLDGTYENVFIGRMGSFTDEKLVLMCPVPEVKPKYFNIIKPFTIYIWAGLFVAIVGSSIFFHLFQVLSHEESLFGLHNSLFYIYGMIFGNYRKVEGPGKFFVGSGWAVFIMFFIFFFNSNLSAYLISSDFNDPIESMDDLVYKSNLILTLASDRQWAPENENYYKTLEGLGRLNEVGGANDYRHANKTHCSAHTASSAQYGVYRNLVDFGEPIVRIGKVAYIYGGEGISFACRKKNNFCEELEEKFRLAGEFGIFKKIKSMFIRISREMKTQTPPSALGLEHFLLAYIILLSGISVSCIVFIMELVKHINN